MPSIALARVLAQLVDRPVVDGDADDRAVEQPALLEPVERAEGHHLRQVAGDPEDHEHVRGLRACGPAGPRPGFRGGSCARRHLMLLAYGHCTFVVSRCGPRDFGSGAERRLRPPDRHPPDGMSIRTVASQRAPTGSVGGAAALAAIRPHRDPGGTFVREPRPRPVDDRLRPVLAGRQQGEVHGAPGERGRLALHRPPARHLDHGRAAADRRHRALVVVLERLGRPCRRATRAMFSPACSPDCSATDPSCGSTSFGLRVGDPGDVADREHLGMPGDREVGLDRDPAAALELDAERAGDRVRLQAGSPDERVRVEHPCPT